MRFRWLCCVVMVAPLLLGACSGGNGSSTESSVGTVPGTATTVPVTSSTIVATTLLTTTTVPPTTTTVAPEVLVAEVHTRVFTELFDVDERVDGPIGLLSLTEDLLTGVLIERLRGLALDQVASGNRTVGKGYVSNIVEVVVTGETASVLDCSRDTGEVYSGSGELIVPADDFFKLRRSLLVLVEGRWLMEEIYTGGDERCDPSDLT